LAPSTDFDDALILSGPLQSGSHTEMALCLGAIYHDRGVTWPPEETILKAYDTMTGVEKPALAKIWRVEEFRV